jgi:hypothetical protein
MPDVFHAAGGKIIQQHHPVAILQKAFREMGTYKSSAACYQVTQTASL